MGVRTLARVVVIAALVIWVAGSGWASAASGTGAPTSIASSVAYVGAWVLAVGGLTLIASRWR
ncbi:MAG: hypothetical protein ACRDYV_08920 [Acidimicrobiia bacterium]